MPTPPLLAILFDLDGTLIDAYAVHFAAYRYLFARFGVEIDEARFRQTYSPNWRRTFELMGLPPEHWAQADVYWMEEAARHTPEAFPGVPAMLERLGRRFRLGVVTSGTRSRVLREMAALDLLRRFAVVITGDDVERKKPDPQGLELALAALGVTAAQAVYIGDAEADRQMAEAAGMRFIGVPSQFNSLAPVDGGEWAEDVTAVEALL